MPENVYLQERDLKLINLCVDVGYLTVEMAKRYVYNCDLHTVRRRLLKLERAGFISSYYRPEGTRGRKLFIPNLSKTSKAISKEKYSRLAATVEAAPWERYYFEHEDAVRDFALMLAQLGSPYWLSFDYNFISSKDGGIKEYLRSRDKLPDIVYRNERDERINFEIELNVKSEARYSRKIRDLIYESSCPTIYVVETSDLENKLREIIVDNLKDSRGSSKSKQERVHVYSKEELASSYFVGLAVDRILGRGVPLRRPHFEPPDKNFALFELDGSSKGCAETTKFVGPSGVADHPLPS